LISVENFRKKPKKSKLSNLFYSMKKLLLLPILLLFISFAPKQLEWVAIGDSITYLNDHQAETGNRITKGFMTLVTEKLPHIHYTNIGKNGWTTGNIADNIDKIGIEKADIYTVFLGTNDWWQGRPIGTMADYQNSTGKATIFGAYKIIIDKLKSQNLKAKIILMTPLQRGDFVYINNFKNNAYGSYKAKNGQNLSQVADAIIMIGQFENYKVVDLYHKSGINLKNMVNFKRLKNPATGQYQNYKYPEYIGIPYNPSTDEYPYPIDASNMTYDGLHPSDKGYQKISKMLVKLMKKY
jgi:lysophospholipase L1-like esterase